MSTAHTPTPKKEGDLPWTYTKSPSVNGNDNCYEIHWSEDGECVAEVVHGEKAASLIVTACNSYYDHLAEIDMLKAMVNDLADVMEAHLVHGDTDMNSWIEKARKLTGEV
jgi:hypothetical protein